MPLRVISENLGYQVDWLAQSRQVKISKGSEELLLTIASKQVNYSKERQSKVLPIEVAPKIKDNSTFVPIRAIAELFGQRVDWDQANQRVIIGEGYLPGQDGQWYK